MAAPPLNCLGSKNFKPSTLLLPKPVGAFFIAADLRREGASQQETKETSSAFFYQFRTNIRHNRYLVKLENSFGQHKCISSTVGIYSFFFRRFFNQQFKRSCLPDGPKVGSISISPRGDWRMPSDANSAMWLKEIEAL